MPLRVTFPKAVSYFFASCMLFTSCVSSTVIRSYPNGADLRIDGVDVGKTPYRYEDTKITFSTTDIRLSAEGYRTLNTSISKDEEVDVGPAVAGFFVLIPWLWVMKYKSNYTFDLKPETPAVTPPLKAPTSVDAPATSSKSDRLRELKSLLDEGLITQTDYDLQKKKILEEQ
jgi:hypothetical protein